jgi:hypothetical protein
VSDELLRSLLELARREGALSGDGVEAFARALEQRAALILEERVRALEERAAVLSRENAWREETARNLEAESRWRAEAMRSLGDQASALEAEIDRLRVEWGRSAAAHERLLAHHQATVRWLAESLETLAPAPRWGLGRLRQRLEEIVAALRRELA